MRQTIGILGGMGPQAGIYFSELVTKRNKAVYDQDHVSFVLYSEPSIPNRTEAILSGETARLVSAVIKGLKKLESFGVSEIFIPCNTSHVGFVDYQREIKTPIYSLPHAAIDKIPPDTVATLLATPGTYEAQVYDDARVSYPTDTVQSACDKLIKVVKAQLETEYLSLMTKLMEGVTTDSVILGCTELSYLTPGFRNCFPDKQFIDPLEIAADHVIEKYSSQTVRETPKLLVV